MTLPQQVIDTAGIAIGDRLRLQADGDGRIIVERIGDSKDAGVSELFLSQPELPAA